MKWEVRHNVQLEMRSRDVHEGYNCWLGFPGRVGGVRMMRCGNRALVCASSLILLVAAAGAMLASRARACAIPVYRYAIENWPPESYLILNFHHGASSAEDQALIKSLNESHANASITDCNIDQEIPQEFQALWEANKTKLLPYMVLVAPANTADNNVLWTGPWSKANVDGLLHSPLRKKLTDKMESGQAGVWILIESGNKATDDLLMEMFEKTLRELSERFTADVKASAEAMPKDPNVGGGDAEHPAPDAVKLSVLRATRKEATDDPLFAGILREQLQKSEACAVLVFGRGRLLGPLPEKELKPDHLEASTRFLTGPCMCSIKEQRIGVDLLLDLDSDKIGKPKEQVEKAAETETPAKSAIAVPVTPPSAPIASAPPPTPQPAAQASAATPSQAHNDAPVARFGSGLTLAGALIAAGIVALILASRRGTA